MGCSSSSGFKPGQWDPNTGVLNLQRGGAGSKSIKEWPEGKIKRAGPENIRQLKLGFNDLISIPPPAKAGAMRNLEVLELFGNQLTTEALKVAGPELRELRALRVLDLRNNQLRALPPWIGDLANLEKLNVSCNRIESLPPEIGKLEELKELDIQQNVIAEFPAEMANMHSLTTLNYQKNAITELPEHVASLPSLKTVNFMEVKKGAMALR
eukprot:tig00020556_g11035.t1